MLGLTLRALCQALVQDPNLPIPASPKRSSQIKTVVFDDIFKWNIEEDLHFCAIFWILSWLWLVKALFQITINSSAKQNTGANPQQFIWSEWFFNEWSSACCSRFGANKGEEQSHQNSALDCFDFWSQYLCLNNCYFTEMSLFQL